MREMKDSGIEWIGEIPNDWNLKPIYTVFEEVVNKNYNGNITNALKFTYGTIVRKQNFDADEDDYVANTILNYTIVTPGTIMLNGLNLNYDFVSQRIGLVKEKGIITSAYMAFRPNKTNIINSEFATYLFKAYDGCKAFHNMGGGVRKILNFTEFKKYYVPFPSINEQRCIVSILNEKCSEIDTASEDIQKQITILEDYKKSVITEAVTKGINPDVEMKDSGIEWIGKIPKHWSVMHNKYIMTKEKTIKEIYGGEDIISLSMNGVIVRDLDAGGKMPKTFDGYQIVHPGNLLMCLFDYDVTPRCIGLIKNFGVTSPAYSQFVMNKDNHSGYYNYYYLMVDHTKAILHLAKNLRHSFTEEQLGSISAPVPPIEEQVAIEKFLDQKCSEIDSLISDKKKQLEILADYKKSLIYEYVTGKKEVPES